MGRPGMLELSVVEVPDDRWGRRQRLLSYDARGWTSLEDVIQFTRDRIAYFKCPRYVEFGELPKTATGKIQKFILREKEWAGYDTRIHGSTA